MTPRLSALLLAFVPIAALAGSFRSASLSDDRTTLVITSADGSSFEAPKLSEQVQFDQPRVSPDGRHVGWLARYADYYTYPIALDLVILDESRRLHTFEGSRPLFAWCFTADARSVALGQAFPHFSQERLFERRRIGDERLLAAYAYPEEERKNRLAQRRAPVWVRCVSPPSD